MLRSKVKNQCPCEKLTYSTIADFKGLEKKFVAIVDLDVVYEESYLISLLYIAMTRANAGLWIVMTPNLQKFISDQQEDNTGKSMPDG